MNVLALNSRVAGLASAIFLAMLVATLPARAEAPFPTRPITIVVPYPAGGTADMLARLVGEGLRGRFGQPVVVENRQGAGGNVGAEAVARSAPDGYTLLCAPQLSFSAAHLLYPRLNYDPRAFVPVSVLARYPTVILGRADLPANDMAQFIAYARANPGKLNYGSQGSGQIAHLTFELMKRMAGIDMLHIPFRGSAPAITALLGGQIDILADNLLATAPAIEAKRLKLLGTGGASRLTAFPDVPAVAESLPGFESETWMAIAAPPGTPPEIAAQLSDAIAKVMQSPDVKARIADLYAEPFGSTPAQMAELIRQSTERWSPVIAAAHIAVE